jgi:hypothetical protein
MDTEQLRKLAIRSNDGDLRGPALAAASSIDALEATNTRLLAALASIRSRALEGTVDHDDAGNLLCAIAGMADYAITGKDG